MIQNDDRWSVILYAQDSESIPMVSLKLFANIGVSIFALITGFYGIRFTTRKMWTITYKTWFYMIIITAIYFSLGLIGTKKALLNLIPLHTHWYINAYVLLMLIIALVNKNIEMMSEKMLLRWLLVSGVIFYCFSWMTGSFGTNISLLLFLYCMGRLLSRKQAKIAETLRGGVKIIYLIPFAILLLFVVIICVTKANIILNLMGSNFNPLVLLMSISLLLFAANRKILTNKIINKLSGGAFAAYIITESPIRNTLFNLVAKMDYNVFNIVAFSICAYLLCAIIDMVLSPLEKKQSTFLYNKISEFIFKHLSWIK